MSATLFHKYRNSQILTGTLQQVVPLVPLMMIVSYIYFDMLNELLVCHWEGTIIGPVW